MFHVHPGSTLSLTGVTLQNGKVVRLTDKHARGGACSGAAIQRILQRLFAAAFALHQWRCSFRIGTSPHLLITPLFSPPPSPVQGGNSAGAIFVEGHLDATSCSFKNNTAVRGGQCACAAISFSPPPLFLYTPVVKSV